MILESESERGKEMLTDMKLFSDDMSFYKANFHCHTTESDGHVTPQACVDFYADAGYDILSITDHRSVTKIVSDRLLLIPGIEIDYILPGQWVHILGLNMDASIGGKWNRTGTPQEGIDLIRSLGGIAVLAHPAWSLNTPAFMRSLTGLSGVEIWNSVSTLPMNGDRAESTSLMDVTWPPAENCYRCLPMTTLTDIPLKQEWPPPWCRRRRKAFPR